MKFIAFAVLALAVVPAGAAPVLFLNPSSQVSGRPGQTVGWGFTLSSTNSNYIVVDSFSFIPLSPSLGAFTDFSQYNFIDVGPSTPETQLFSLANLTGVGSLQIANFALPGTTTGAITMVYDLYNGDPANGGALLSSGNIDNVAADVVVTAAPTPEPATLKLAGCAAILLLLYSARRLRKHEV
jgi:hypothetical protein